MERDEMLKMLMRISISIPALAVVVPVAAQAADPAFCGAYATAALNQVRGALSNRASAAGAQGARWSTERPCAF
jgi:hypothetical protein